MPTPLDRPHSTPEKKATKPSGVATQDMAIDTPQMHQQVINILKDPQFGMADLLQGKETLGPQDVTVIWRGENLKMLQNFPLKGTANQKEAYLKQHPKLMGLVNQTRQILAVQARKKDKPDQEINPDDVLAADLQQMDAPEDKSSPETLDESDLPPN